VLLLLALIFVARYIVDIGFRTKTLFLVRLIIIRVNGLSDTPDEERDKSTSE
jgi:hypothetical protein